MLEALRQQSQSWLIWAALGIIIIVFIFFFGPQSGGFDPSQKSWAAKVRGSKIYNTELAAAVDRTDQLGQRNVNANNQNEVTRDVLLDMAMVHLLADEARSEGLRISDDELSCYIVNWNQSYKVDGEYICRQFSRSYQMQYPNLDYMFYSDPAGNFAADFDGSVRRWFALSSTAYEDWKEQELLAFHYLDILTAGLPVDDASVSELVSRRADKIDLEYVRLAPPEDAEPSVSEAAVDQFLANNRAEVETYYEQNRDNYTNEKKVQLRRIGIRKPGDSESDAYAEAQAKYEEALAAAQEVDADFEALVAEYTEFEQDRESNGDMGMRTEDNLSNDLWEAASGLSEGGVAGVELGFAWNIIKLEEQTPAGTTPLEEVEREIARTLIRKDERQQKRERMTAQGERILAYAKENNTTLAEAVQSLVPTTPQPDNDEEGTEDSSASEASTTQDSAATPASDDDSAGNEEAATTGAPGLAAETTGPFSFEPSPPDLSGIEPQLRQYVNVQSRNPDEVPKVGRSPELVARAFQLTEEAPLIDEIVEVDGVPYLIRLKEKTSPEDTEQLRTDIAGNLRSSLANEWFAPIRTRLKLVTHNGQPFAPALQDLLDRSIAAGDITIREELFPEGEGIPGTAE